MNDLSTNTNEKDKLRGTYSEPFYNSNGKLIVDQTSFKIEFYFPGVDLRYNGDLIYIYERDIDKYILAIEKNWQRLCELKEISKSLKNITLNEDGICNMHLTAKENTAILYIFKYNLPVKNKSDIETFLLKLKCVKSRVDYIKNKIYE